MKKILTTLFPLTLLITTAHASPSTLTTYDQLLQALHQGENVRAIINLDKCTNKSKTKTAAENPDVTGAFTRMDFKLFSYYKIPVDKQTMRYTIATSYSTLTEHRTLGLVYGYARLRVFDDGSAEFHVANYDPKTFEQKAEMNFICHLSNGVEDNGVALYMR